MAFPSLRALLIAGLLAILATAPAAAQVGKTVAPTAAETATRGNYITSPEARAAALAKLIDHMGGARPVSKLEIRPEEIVLWTQNPTRPYYTDAWTVSRLRLWVFGSDTVGGPQPSQGDGIVRQREGSFFPLESIRLDGIEQLIADATALARMEQVPEVEAIIIARRIALLPEPHYGDVQMTLELRTERESATVHADADARVLGADLSGTSRALRLDLVGTDDWPMAEAQRRIAEVLGSRKLHELRVYDRYVFVQAQHPRRDDMTIDYSWDLGGVKSGLEMEDHFASVRDTAPFSMDEIDLSRLPEVKRAALDAFDSPAARIGYIYADKPTDRAGLPQVLWRVDIKQADGESGAVLLDASAKVVEVRLPESRAAAALGPWLAPATVAATLKRLEREFGPDARYGEILINDTQGSVLVEDPQTPGKMASFIVGPQSVTRFGTPMPWEATLDPARAFTIAELAPLDAAAIDAMEKRTLERMRLEGAAVFRYTISKHMLMMSPDDARLLVEVRAGKDDGWTSGWVTYDLGGAEADVMLP